MKQDQIHRAISADGTEIAGRIVGQGPPLVLIHGGMGDGETSWRALAPHLCEAFTCYMMSLRGRGLSAEPPQPDFSIDRLVEDVTAFAESVGEPVGLFGYSSGGTVALAAAGRSDAVSAVAVYEPPVFEAHPGDSEFADSLGVLIREAVEEDRAAAAARLAIEGVVLDDEKAALTAAGAFERWARNVPTAVHELEQAGTSTIAPTAPATLAQITAPVLYLHGSLTPTDWYAEGGRHVARHAADARLQEIAGIGHFAPALDPEPVAKALIEFFGGIENLSLSQPTITPEEDIAMPHATIESTLAHATSADGTEIGYWITGEGPPLVLVHGLLGDHSRWGVLLPHLEPHVTVHAMDRRGRGASGDQPDYDFAREVEDVVAVVDAIAEATGEPVYLLGNSGGGSFALAAAALTDNIRRLVVFEPPGREVLERVPEGLADRLDDLIAAGDREGTLELAYRTIAGMSDEQIQHLRGQPEWPNRLAAAHTVPRELRLPPERMFDPEHAARVSAPTLLLVGSESPQPYRVSAEAVAAAVPDVQVVLLEGQGHAADLLAPALFAEHVLQFLMDGSGR